MWSIVNSMGNPAHPVGPFGNQKREFSLNVDKVPIVPGKTFSNPNFVIKQHPSMHNHNNIVPVHIPVEKFSCIDSTPNTNSGLINSSQSLVDTLKEYHLDTVKTPEVAKAKMQPRFMCSKKRNRKYRRNRRKIASGKNSNKHNVKNEIKDMMDVEVDTEPVSDLPESQNIPKATFNLTDFIVYEECSLSTMPVHSGSFCDSDDEDSFVEIISVSPLSISKTFIRERQLSMTDSEDSFIVFNPGSDEELESCDETDTETDDVESCDETDTETEEEAEDEVQAEREGVDEVDFVCHATPRKKVRFAEDADLCEVHKMVQWSYAYQKARKGPWEEYARDRDRFKRRVFDVERVLKPVFNATHRNKVYQERFAGETACSV